MRTISGVIVVLLSASLLLEADVTIRYKTEMSSPLTPAANRNTSSVIYMKGTKGVTISDSETTIVDFAKQEVTVIDTVRKKYATVPASQYAAQAAASLSAAMPQADTQDILKSMKSTCDSKASGRTETIQGVLAEEREVTCTTAVSLPEGMKDVMPSSSIKMVMHLWFASPGERVRVPGLWQLSGFELWQKAFMNPTQGLSGIAPEGMAPMMEALQKDQSATLRSSTDMSMSMTFPGGASPAVDTPIMKMHSEVVELSTAPLDDSLFVLPEGYTAEPLADLSSAVMQAALESAKAQAASTAATSPIPSNVKAYIASLSPLHRTMRPAVVDADGKKIGGIVELLVTIGPNGNVTNAEPLSGPQELRQTASDTLKRWTYRPVIRDDAPVTALTDASVDFTDYSTGVPAGAFQFTPEMAAAQERLSQLAEAFPRSLAQELADLEQESGGGDASRRYNHLGDMALLAAKLGQNDKAQKYANELLVSAQRGNAIHDGHMVLGLVALHTGDIPSADQQLLEAGKTTGSPQLNSFGPNMLLASELLKAGERNTVLDYLDECRKFWKMGASRIDSWSATIRSGVTPAFAPNLR